MITPELWPQSGRPPLRSPCPDPGGGHSALRPGERREKGPAGPGYPHTQKAVHLWVKSPQDQLCRCSGGHPGAKSLRPIKDQSWGRCLMYLRQESSETGPSSKPTEVISRHLGEQKPGAWFWSEEPEKGIWRKVARPFGEAKNHPRRTEMPEEKREGQPLFHFSFETTCGRAYRQDTPLPTAVGCQG